MFIYIFHTPGATIKAHSHTHPTEKRALLEAHRHIQRNQAVPIAITTQRGTVIYGQQDIIQWSARNASHVTR
jgi:hypothetical protein